MNNTMQRAGSGGGGTSTESDMLMYQQGVGEGAWQQRDRAV